MKTCIIVPIKTQNKRLPGKTFKLLNGKPLYTYMFETLKSQTKADVYIDSSDEEVLRIANEWGFKTLKRPEEFNSDSTAGDQLLMRIVDMLDYDIVGDGKTLIKSSFPCQLDKYEDQEQSTNLNIHGFSQITGYDSEGAPPDFYYYQQRNY